MVFPQTCTPSCGVKLNLFNNSLSYFIHMSNNLLYYLFEILLRVFDFNPMNITNPPYAQGSGGFNLCAEHMLSYGFYYRSGAYPFVCRCDRIVIIYCVADGIDSV